jgi:hypothetical protein
MHSHLDANSRGVWAANSQKSIYQEVNVENALTYDSRGLAKARNGDLARGMADYNQAIAISKDYAYFVTENLTPKGESAFSLLSQWLNRTLRSIVPEPLSTPARP